MLPPLKNLLLGYENNILLIQARYPCNNKQAEGLPLFEPPMLHPSTPEFPLEVYKAVLYWA